MRVVSALPLSVLADAISASFSKAVFPSCLKRAQIIPLYKSGDRSCPANYRPIALHPALSKVLEKPVQRRIMSFLERHELLSPALFGFRPGMGTNDAIFSFLQDLYGRMNSGDITAAVLASKARPQDLVLEA